ncbi:MAG: hypothetical protein WC450_08900 [Candidatus Omnitrophota bacterium]|jgi:hypothetical protein
MSDNIYYSKTLLTGGTAAALDYIDGDLLSDGDWAFVPVSGVLHVYKLDATAGTTELSPDRIVPDTHPGTKVWELQSTGKTPIAVTPKTADGTLSANELVGNAIINNTGAGAAVNLLMQAAMVNLGIQKVVVTVAQYLRLTAAGTDKFRYAGTAGAAGGYIRANTVGTSFEVKCVEAGYWDIFNIENPPVLYDA